MDKVEESVLDLLNETYTMCFVSLKDVLEEKADLAQQYIIVLTLLGNTFSDNRNLEDALLYVNSIMGEFFSETEFEEKAYNKILAYFASFENLTDCTDQEILNNLKNILVEFDSKVDAHFIEWHDIFEYYTDIIESGILTDKNYYHKGLTQVTDEEDKEEILAKIPEVKKNV